MKVAIRVDSSFKMGSGHLMRCLTLADRLRERECIVSFLCRELPGNMIDYVETKGYKVYRLPYMEQEKNKVPGDLKHSDWLGVDWGTDAIETKSIIEKDGCADWLIVDHYALDNRWEERIRPFVKKIMVIDDLADRPHDCDLLLDQNLYEDINNRYNGLVPSYCNKLLGPIHALLRNEFIEARKNLRERDGNVKNILIFFGGADPTNETLKTLEAIQILNRRDIAIDVVVGVANPNKDKIEDVCSAMPNAHFHCQVDNMAQLMLNADLVIGAGGTITWERCFLGLPAITLVVAQNQAETSAVVAKRGAAWNLGRNEHVSPYNITQAIKNALADPAKLKVMHEKAILLMGEFVGNNSGVLSYLLEKEQK